MRFNDVLMFYFYQEFLIFCEVSGSFSSREISETKETIAEVSIYYSL